MIFDRYQSNVNGLHQLVKALSARTLLALVNAFPEDVALIRKNWNGEVYASFRGESAQRHQQVVQIASYRAKRLTEQGIDVNLVISSLNEVAMADRAVAEQSEKPGCSSLGVGAAQRIFAQGRNFRIGGSLTVWGGMHRDRSAYEEEVYERLFYEATGRLFHDSSMPANIDLEASRQAADQL